MTASPLGLHPLGEQYFDAPVYKHMEEIARHGDRITRSVSFPLAEYDKAPV